MSTIEIKPDGPFTVRIDPKGWLGSAFHTFRAAIEGAKYDGKRRTNVAAVDKLPRILRELRTRGFQVSVTPDVAKALEGYQSKQWLDTQAAKSRVAAIDADIRSRGGAMRNYQKVGAEWLVSRHGGILADDMGTGKTLQTIAALPANTPILVIAPAVAKGVWARELLKWRPSFGRVTRIDGRDNFRWPNPASEERESLSTGEVVIVNYDILPDGHEEDCAEKSCPGCAEYLEDCPDGLVIVADESHALKNSKAKRTRAVKAMSLAARSKGGKVWLLTATPLLNRPPELWSLLDIAGCAQEAFGTWGQFKEVMGGEDEHVYVKGGRGATRATTNWTGKLDESVTDRLQRVMLRRTKVEVLDELPPKSHELLSVDVDKAALKACDDALKEMGGAAALERTLLEGKDISFETWSRARSALAKAKTPAMLELVSQYEEAEEPVVVFSAHLAPIRMLSEREGWAIITGETPAKERTEIENAFQEGKLRGIGCTIKAGGVAITLTRARHEVFVDREPVPALNDQAEDRCYRIGQTRGVLVRILVAKHPLDERVAEICMGKKELVDGTVNAAQVKKDQTLEHIDVDLEALRVEAEKDIRYPSKSSKPVQKLTVKTRGPRTPVEVWAVQGLAQLVATDSDYATERNGVGFNKFDGAAGRDLHRMSKAGLTERQWAYAVGLVTKYSRQVGPKPEGTT